MKILFFMSHAGYVRNFESPLRILAERGHAVNVGVDRETKENLPGHADLLNALVSEYPSITADTAPAGRATNRRIVALGAQAWLDYLRFFEPEFDGATKLRARAGARLPGPIRRLTDTVLIRRRMRPRASRLLRATYQAVPIDASVRAYIERHAPDVVLVTPLVDLVSPQREYVQCAKAMGIPTCLPVASWDNLTTKGLIHEQPDIVTVWSDAQRREAETMHGVPSDRIVVTGAVAHDHWFDWRPLLGREEFCGQLGLDSAQPFVAYVGSSPFIAPDEASFAARWIKALRAARGGALADLQVLIRPHPQNPLTGRGLSELDALDRVVIHPKGGANPTDAESRSVYYDSLWHSAAVMGINTSAFLEGAIVGRPVHTLLDPAYDQTQRGTPHFRHLLPENGGVLHAAATVDEQVPQIQRSLSANGSSVNDASEFVTRFLRPITCDASASARLVDVIEGLGGTREGRSGRRPGKRPIVGRVLARAGLVAVPLWRTRRSEG